MFETAAAACLGISVTIAVVALAMPAPGAMQVRPAGVLRRILRDVWAEEAHLAAGAGWPWLDRKVLIGAQLAFGAAGAVAAFTATGLPALAAPGAVGATALVRGLVSARAAMLRSRRQDAVVESVRMLRQLLETGATGVHQGLMILAERGPAPLRSEFRAITAGAGEQRQAWAAARDRIGEPMFDLFAAAIQVQRSGGGELGPLFAELEASMSSTQEIEREAQALQVQARSAATIIVSLPIAFLVVMSMLHSPYLDAFRTPIGETFLLAMLGVMAASYVWIRRLLRLPGLARMRLADV